MSDGVRRRSPGGVFSLLESRPGETRRAPTQWETPSKKHHASSNLDNHANATGRVRTNPLYSTNGCGNDPNTRCNRLAHSGLLANSSKLAR